MGIYEEFLEITRHNEEQYAGIEARGEAYNERLGDLVCMVLAEVFHPLARERYGSSSEASLRRVLEEMFCSPDSESEWENGKEKALEALRAEGFNGQ